MKIPREKIFTFLNLHLFGLVLLLALNLALGARLLIAWHTLYTAGPEHLQQQQSSYRTLQLAMLPLRGLPTKVDLARKRAAEFYDARFPGAYSTVSAAIYDLAATDGVRITRVSYTQTPAIPGLAEVRMDASLSGEYSAIMHYINGLERSKTFFLIDGVTLTGQQGGLVNLRLRVTTYLHAPDLEHLAPPVSNQADTSGEEAP